MRGKTKIVVFRGQKENQFALVWFNKLRLSRSKFDFGCAELLASYLRTLNTLINRTICTPNRATSLRKRSSEQSASESTIDGCHLVSKKTSNCYDLLSRTAVGTQKNSMKFDSHGTERLDNTHWMPSI